MRIAFNPSTVAALTTPPNNKDITFDLRGRNIFARGVKFCGTDTNTWRDIKINNVSIGSNILDLRNGSNTTLTNTNGVVTINSTWRPVVDNLTSDSTTSSLSANLGRVLAGLINTLSTNISNLYALRDGSNATGRWRGGLACLDVRDTNYTPYDLNMGLELHFFNNNTNNLKDGGVYNGVFSFRPWSSGSNWTGGKAHLLSFTDNGNIWHRTSSGDDSWETWKKLAYSTDIPSSLKNPYALTISLNGTSQGPYDGSTAKNINITPGSIGAATSEHNHDNRYLKLTGGTMQLGEGLKFHADENYFGTNSDARIISLLDLNDKICDGGLIIDERGTFDGKEYVTELLRIRNSEFKWKGSNILHSGNSNINGNTITINNSSVSVSKSDHTHTWQSIIDKVVAGNEFNIVNAGFNSWLYFNYLPVDNRNSSATITLYNMGNGNKGLASVYAYRFKADGKSCMWKDARNYAPFYATFNGGFEPILDIKTVSGDWSIGSYDSLNNSLVFSFTSDSDFNAGVNGTAWYYITTNGTFSGASRYINHTPGDPLSYMYSTSTGTYGGAIQIREVNGVQNNQSAWGYAPRITFHWGLRYAKGFGIRSDGLFAVDDVPIALTSNVLTFSNETADYLSANFNNPDFSKKAASKYIECWDGAGGWWNWMAGKFMKAGSSDAYVLLGGGGHKPLSEFLLGSGSYLPYNGWWASGSGLDINDANGMIFAYATHKNTPFSSAWGIITTFDYTYNSNYKFLLAANGYSNAMYYRSRSNDRGGWTSWALVIDTGNIGSLRVAYATSAGSVAWSNVTGKPSSFTPSAHDHNYVLDIANNTHTTFAYSKSGLSKDSITWLAVWNGYELRAMNKDQIALSGHTHDDRYLKLTGGTMTGTIRFNNLINIDSAIVLDYKHSAGGFARDIVSMKNSVYGDANLGALSILCYPNSTSNGFLYIYLGTDKYDGPNNLRIYKNKVTFGNNILIDAGNIGNLTVANAYHLRINSANSWSTWNWAGLEGLPSWLWGSNDGTNMYVWNPSNFRVTYASSAGNADTLDGYHASSFSLTSHTHDYISRRGMMNSAYACIPTYNGETGWHRIATIREGIGYGSYILYLCGSWSYSSNTNAIIHIDTMHTTAQLTQVSGIVGYIDSIRLVNISSNAYYVDVHINYTGANTPGTVYCYFLGNGTITPRTSAEKITESVTSSAELDLVNGGRAHSASSVVVNNSDSNSTYRMVWHSGNTLYGTNNIYCNPYSDQIYSAGFRHVSYNSASYLLRSDGGVAAFNWSGQSGLPTWLWGGNNLHSYYVYNPSNFSVKYATSAGSVSNSLNIFGVSYNGSAAKTITTSTFVSLLSEGTSTVTDGTMFITSWASDNGFADTNAVNVPYKRKASCLWNYIDSKISSKYLPLAGGTMNGNARIGHGSGNLYIGNSGNDGWIYTQDIASLNGTDKWAIRTSGAAHFGDVYICTKSDYSTYDTSIIECYSSTLYLNYYSPRGINLCNGGGTVQIGPYTSGDTGNNKLYVNGSEFINGASNVKDHVFADGFRHRSHNSDDAVLLAGGGYSQGVPVRYWAIYYMYIGNSSTDVTYTKRSGNYNFITSEAWESEGSARFDIRFPSGYNKNNTLIFGNGDHRTSSSWKTPVYVTITTSASFGSESQIRVMISDDASLNVGFANIYFMCMG